MTPLAFAVLRRLSDGGFHSGEAIARALGVSRGSVWNALHAAEGAGIKVFKVRGRGYCLAQPVDWLDRDQVHSALGTAAGIFDLEILDAVDSTSTLLGERVAVGERHGKVIAAELQSAGRGRRGRTWHCGLGEGLTFSLLWRFPQGPASLAGLSLAVGVGLARACDQLGAGGVGLKWPNDVVHRSGKLAGTLIEIQGEIQGPSAAVVGVGINLRFASGARDLIDQPVADLASLNGELPGRNRVLGTMLAQLAQVLAVFEAEGFAPLKQEWSARHAYQGRAVTLRLPDGSALAGTVSGVEDDGSLLLRTAFGVRRLFGGEISLRGGA